MTQHDPALLSAALYGAERALNQAILLAPTSHSALEALDGTLIGVEITSLELTLYLALAPGPEVRLLSHCEDTTATKMTATGVAARGARAHRADSALQSGRVLPVDSLLRPSCGGFSQQLFYFDLRFFNTHG